jgi:hypothetical protein
MRRFGMEKLRLQLNALHVDSFEIPSAEWRSVGTVRAHQGATDAAGDAADKAKAAATAASNCPTCDTCDAPNCKGGVGA